MKAYKGMPKKVKVGDLIYKVCIRDIARDPELDNSYAYTMVSYPTIVVGSHLTLEQAKRYLVHELMHAMMLGHKNTYMDSIYKTKKKKPSAGDWEHYFIGALQGPLVELLRSNPKLVAFLVG